VIGLFALGWTVASRLRATSRWLLATVAIGFAAVNMHRGLAPEAMVPAPLRGTPLLAGANPPLLWPDFEELLRLVRDLRHTASPSDPIYVASSKRLSSSSLRSADRMLDDPFAGNDTGGEIWLGGRLNIPHTPHVDSRDENPTGALMRASYVVVADPPQYHLRPEEQRLVRAAVDAFKKPWELASDFALLPGIYSLEDGAKVRVYHRARTSTLETALRTFVRMRAELQRTAEPNPLLYIGTRQDVEAGPGNGGELTAVIPLWNGRDTVPLLLTETVPVGSRLRADAQFGGTTCGKVAFAAAPVVGDTVAPPTAYATLDGSSPRALDMPIRGSGSAALLRVWSETQANAPGDHCRLTLRNVKLVRASAHD
jgi:hypothetical protein